jgi:hypothetical protein
MAGAAHSIDWQTQTIQIGERAKVNFSELYNLIKYLTDIENEEIRPYIEDIMSDISLYLMNQEYDDNKNGCAMYTSFIKLLANYALSENKHKNDIVSQYKKYLMKTAKRMANSRKRYMPNFSDIGDEIIYRSFDENKNLINNFEDYEYDDPAEEDNVEDIKDRTINTHVIQRPAVKISEGILQYMRTKYGLCDASMKAAIESVQHFKNNYPKNNLLDDEWSYALSFFTFVHCLEYNMEKYNYNDVRSMLLNRSSTVIYIRRWSAVRMRAKSWYKKLESYFYILSQTLDDIQELKPDNFFYSASCSYSDMDVDALHNIVMYLLEKEHIYPELMNLYNMLSDNGYIDNNNKNFSKNMLYVLCSYEPHRHLIRILFHNDKSVQDALNYQCNQNVSAKVSKRIRKNRKIKTVSGTYQFRKALCMLLSGHPIENLPKKMQEALANAITANEIALYRDGKIIFKNWDSLSEALRLK